MFQEFFARSELLRLPLIGMILCFFAFVGVVVRVYVGLRHGESVDHLASMPLEDDPVAGSPTTSEGSSIR
jgi:hypothetical protein